jgi:DNA-binding NarL/FixJ family response regulator
MGSRELAPTGQGAITCVVADDHPAVMALVTDLLVANGIRVVARATDGGDALAAIEAHEPTVAVLDLVMPGMGGVEVARRARERSPRTAAVIYTGRDEEELLVEAVDAGARAFVRKEGAGDELVHAVEVAAAGSTYIDPALAPVLVRGSALHPAVPLSAREREILRHLADGMTNDEIGTALFISGHTVRTHLRRAMHKLDADNRTEAVATALRESLIT